MKSRRWFLSVMFLIACGIQVVAQSSSSKGISVGKVTKNGESFVPAVIKSKPEPERPGSFTANTKITIILRAVFTRDGKVTDVKFEKARPKNLSKKVVKELTYRCIDAARQIEFIPAMKDGHPVSMYMQLEYSFDPEAETQKSGKPNK